MSITYSGYYNSNKEKFVKRERYADYMDMFETTLISMFDYKEFPKTFRSEFFEHYLLTDGMACAYNIDGEWYACRCVLVPNSDGLTVNGYGSDAIVTTENGHEYNVKDWETNDNIVVCFNNSTWSEDLNIMWFGQMLSEVDISMKLNVIYSRLKPIIGCASSKQKVALDLILNDLADGKLKTYTTDDIVSAINGNTGIIVDNISDVKYSECLQYLSKFHEDLLRRFYFPYGMDTAGSGKMAQQTTDEINKNSDTKLILPIDRLKWRKKFADRFNEVTGGSVSIEFSDCWKDSKKDLMEAPAEDVEEVEEVIESGDDDV